MDFTDEIEVECPAVAVENTQLEVVVTEEKSLTLGPKRKRQTTLPKPVKKHQAPSTTDLLLQCPASQLKEFCHKTLKREMTEEDNAIQLLTGIFDVTNSIFPIQTVIILIGLICSEHLDQLVHPRTWNTSQLQEYWTEHLNYLILTSTYTTLLIALRKSLKTSYKSMDVHYIRNLCLEDTNILALSLYQIDVVELMTALQNLNLWLSATPLGTGTRLLPTEITSISPISAQTSTNLVDVLGSRTVQQSQNGEDQTFAELLEQSTSNPQTTQVSCDIYVQALDSSKELVASTRMKDYVLDINIYRCVLKHYLLKQRILFINEQNIRINLHSSRALSLKKNIPYL